MGTHSTPKPVVTPTQIKRFRANPIELAVFAVMATVFCNSLYNLFYDQHGFRATALTPMAAVPTSESGGGRAPASVGQSSFATIDVKCEAGGDQSSVDTHANKVRMTGPLCNSETSGDKSKLLKTVVVNTANKFNATVFTDVNSGKFSTDYIPLNTGLNPVHLEFTFRGGKVVTQDVKIVRN